MSKEDFDKFVDELQKEIMEKELEDYNEYIVNLFHNPKNWGKLGPEEMSVTHSYKGPCGDTMQFFFKIKDDVIEKVSFITDGCGASVATGSQATILLEGKPIDYAENFDPNELDSALYGLPEDHKHCAELASRTIRQAIEKYKKEKLK